MQAPTIAKLINGTFEVSTPEEQGIRSKDITNFYRAVEAEDIELHSFYLLRHGKLISKCVSAPFDDDTTQHRIYSAGKVITTLAILFLVQEGKVSLDTKLIDIFKDHLPEQMDERMKQLTVYHLLTMSNGHVRSAFYQMRLADDWLKSFFEQPLKPDYIPGTAFDYNNGAPHMATVLVRLLSGEDMITYLKPRMLDPLGVVELCEFVEGQPDLEPTTQSFTPLGFAKLTQFLLQRGNWEGNQLLRADLVDLIGQRHMPCIDDPTLAGRPSKQAGFGLFVRINTFGGYRPSGGYGQESIVIPESDISCSWLSNIDQPEVERLYELFDYHIVQHTHARPIAANPEDYEELQKVSQGYSIAPHGNSTSAISNQIEGVTYIFDANSDNVDTISFTFDNEKVTMHVSRNGVTVTANAGFHGQWLENHDYPILPTDSSLSAKIKGYEPDRIYGFEGTQPYLLTAAWSKDDTLSIYMRKPDLESTVKHWFVFNQAQISARVHTHFLPRANSKKPDKIFKGNAQ